MREKADKAESFRRTHIVKKLLLDGESPTRIIEYCKAKFGVQEGQAYNYMKKAHEIIEEDSHLSGVADTAWHLMSRMEIYNKQIKAGDLADALRTLRDMAQLQGLYAPAEMNINIADAARRMAEKYNVPFEEIAAQYKEISGKPLIEN